MKILNEAWQSGITRMLQLDFGSVLLNLGVVVLLYLAADLTGGLFHWAEDTFGDENTPFWGPVFVAPNQVHHSYPAAMVRVHWISSNGPIFIVTLVVSLLIWSVGAMSWQFVVYALLAGSNQQVHRFAHMPRVRLPRIILWLQRMRILQDARHHWQHHRSPHLKAYCVLTPWLNPVLDRIGFWRGLEKVLAPIFPTPRRPDLNHFDRA